ncbi:uncharacterized protein B0H18DRAFT_1102348 [Fomitopsis serialis]|uniref:uncharacterized protein n=1 Tax=Fomitopsis serialis TaxID=139415 RepID=UPI002007EDDD|nr:uncharacterized protein B0H18DRAFT_1102348 [Neoantrodia serialis]KAH9932606.1 hypothetical protein B0H18DRAFT_1102348 [Neoantrodia serialis]
MITVELIIVQLKMASTHSPPRTSGSATRPPNADSSTSALDQGFEPTDLVWPKDEYGDFFEEILNIATAKPVSYFVPFGTFPEKITTAPVTEIAVITVKGDVEEYERAYQAAVGAKPPAMHDACYSITKIGGKQVSVVFVGWDSVKAHQSWHKENAAKLQVIGSYLETAALVHVPLKAHI